MKAFFEDKTRSVFFFLLLVFFLKGVFLAAIIPYWQTTNEYFDASYAHLMAETKGIPHPSDQIPGAFRQAYVKAFFPGQREQLVTTPGLSTVENNLYYPALSVIAFLSSPLGFRLELFFLRIFSICLGMGMIYLSHRTMKLLFPGKDLLALTVLLLIAIQPQYTLLSSRVSVVNFYLFTHALLLFLIVRNNMGFSRSAVLGIGAVLLFGIPSEHRLLLAIPVLGWLVIHYLQGGNLKRVFELFEKNAVVLLLFVSTALLSWLVVFEVSVNLFHRRILASPFDFFNQNIYFFQFQSRFWGAQDTAILWAGLPDSQLVIRMLNIINSVAFIGFVVWFIFFCRKVLKVKRPIWPSLGEAVIFTIFLAGSLAGAHFSKGFGSYNLVFSFLKSLSLYALLILAFSYGKDKFSFQLSTLSAGEQPVFFAAAMFSLFIFFSLAVDPPALLASDSYSLVVLVPWFVFFALGMLQISPDRWVGPLLVAFFVFCTGLSLHPVSSIFVPKYYQSLNILLAGSSKSHPLLPVFLVCLIFAGFLAAASTFLYRLMQLEMTLTREG